MRPRSPWLRRNSILLQKNNSSNTTGVLLSTAGFWTIYSEDLVCLRRQVFGTQHLSAMRGSAYTSGCFRNKRWPVARIPARKKTIEQRLTCGCTLTAATWLTSTPDPAATFVAERVPIEIGTREMQQERSYSGGVETSACRRIGEVNCSPRPASGSQPYERSRRCP